MFDFEFVQSLTRIADMAAAVTFAVTGALVASRKELDVLGFMWLAVITGVGGGTLRDLVLGVPVFWVVDPSHLTACLLTAVAVYVAAPWIESRYAAVLWFDALGLAFVTVAGAAKGLESGAGPLVAVVMGVVTGTVGGIVRDLVGQERCVVLRREIYVLATALGACAYVLAAGIGSPWLSPGIAGFVVAFAARGLAIQYQWSLPGYRRPPRRID